MRPRQIDRRLRREIRARRGPEAHWRKGEPPPRNPGDPQAAGENEDPPPTGVTENQGNERRGGNRSDGSSSVDDAHCRRAFFRRKPFRNRAGSGGKATALAHAEQESAREQHCEACGQRVTRTSERPEQHDCHEPSMGSEKIHQLASACVHQGIREQKRGLKSRELPIRQGNVFADRLHGDRQSLAVKIADRDRCADQDGNSPSQNIFLRIPRSGSQIAMSLDYTRVVNVYSIWRFPLQSPDPGVPKRYIGF